MHTAAVPGGETPSGPPHRAPVVCLVTVPVWCLDTAAVPGGFNPPPGLPPSSTPPGAGSQRPPHRAPVVCLVTVPVWCLDTAVPGGGVTLPPGRPPSSTPPGAGSQIYSLILKNPARGHKVKKTPFGRKEHTTYSPYEEKAKMVQKKLGKSGISKKKKKRLVAIGAPAYRRTVERRAAATTNA